MIRRLLDAHSLLWYHFADRQLSATARTAIETPGVTILVSVATLWEIGLKVSKGKLSLTEPFPDFVQHAVFDNSFHLLPVEVADITASITLPRHHNDPYDRMLIAQAVVGQIPVISCDSDFPAYPITLIW